MKQFLHLYRYSLLMIFSFTTGTMAMAQTTLTDGEIIYDVKLKAPSGSSSRTNQSLQNGKLTFNFKNYLFRSEMKIGTMDYINIQNNRSHSAVSLIDGGPGNKYLVRMNSKELKEEAQKFEGMTYEHLSQTKKISGYTCNKAIGKLSNGNTFEVYYTKELQPGYSSYEPRFQGLEGIPLQFEINTQNNTVLVMTASSVNTDVQPSSLFDIPTSGYRELTYNQLQKLRNSK